MTAYTLADVTRAHENAQRKLDIKKAAIGVTNCLTIGGEPILFGDGAISRPKSRTFAFTDDTGKHTFTGKSVQAARDNLIAWLQDRPQVDGNACLHCGNGLTDKRRRYCNVRCRMAYYDSVNARIRSGEAA